MREEFLELQDFGSSSGASSGMSSGASSGAASPVRHLSSSNGSTGHSGQSSSLRKKALDPQTLNTSVSQSPVSGKKLFKLRVNVKDFLKDTIAVNVEKDTIKISGIKVTKSPSGKESQTKCSRKIKKPSNLLSDKFTTTLTKDNVLIIEADLVPEVTPPIKPPYIAHKEAYTPIPMVESSMSFIDENISRIENDQSLLENDLKDKKRNYAKSVEQMKQEFLALYPSTENVESTPEPKSGTQQNGDAVRAQLVDISTNSHEPEKLNEKKMKTLFGRNPETGKKQMSMRFDMKPYDTNTISISTEGGAISIHATKDQQTPEGHKNVPHERNIQLPKNVIASQVRSNLSQDGILNVEAPTIDQESDMEASFDSAMLESSLGSSPSKTALGITHSLSLSDSGGEAGGGPIGGSGKSSARKIEVPCKRDSLTFDAKQVKLLEQMERNMQHEVKRAQKKWESEVGLMYKEFLQLYPVDQDWGSDEFLKSSLVKRRVGDTDILDTEQMKTLYYKNPVTGKRTFKLRFRVEEFEKNSIEVTLETDRIVVTALRKEDVESIDDEKEKEEEKKEETKEEMEGGKEVKGQKKVVGLEKKKVTPIAGARPYVRKIQLPSDVQRNIKSFLTIDGVLIVEAPAKRKAKRVSSRSKSPSTSHHTSSPRASPRGSPYSPKSHTSSHHSGSRGPGASGDDEPPPLPRPGLPVFRHVDGVMQMALIIELGTMFHPRDVTVEASTNHTIMVKAKHTEMTSERFSKYKFKKIYELSQSIQRPSLRAGLTPDGLLIVAALAKGENMTTSISSINLKSLCPANTQCYIDDTEKKEPVEDGS